MGEACGSSPNAVDSAPESSGQCTWTPLGSSWLVISRVISRVTVVIICIRGLITLLITTHEPPSMAV